MSRQSIVVAVVAAASLVVPGAALFVWREQWWPAAAFALWTALAAAVVVLADRKHERRRRERLLERMQQSAIETLSHHRHDWMNELQIVYGYLRLGKPDKAVAVVDRIRSRMEQDSRVSRIGIPKLAAYFLSFRTICDTMKLEVDADDGFSAKEIGLDEDRLSTAVIGLVNVIRLRASVQTPEDNVLRLHFHPGERSLTLELTYGGRLAAADSVPGELRRVLDGFGTVTEAGTDEGAGDGRRWNVAFPIEEKAV